MNKRAAGWFSLAEMSTKDLFGTWSMEDLQLLVSEFNDFNQLSAFDEKRVLLMRKLVSAQLVRFLIHSDLTTVVPERLHHYDLCCQQLNLAHHNHIVSQHLNFSLGGKAPTQQEWSAIRNTAEQNAADSGKLPKEYVRKYPDHPEIMADIDCTHSDLVFSRIGATAGVYKKMRVIPINRITRVVLIRIHPDRYADLQITA